MATVDREEILKLWDAADELHGEKSAEWLMSYVAQLCKCDVGDVADALQGRAEKAEG